LHEVEFDFQLVQRTACSLNLVTLPARDQRRRADPESDSRLPTCCFKTASASRDGGKTPRPDCRLEPDFCGA
jgi:hypothetical protein